MKIRGKITSSLHKPLKKMVERTPIYFEASITLIPKPDKETWKKENDWPVSLMNLHEKYLLKILATKSTNIYKG